MVVNIAVVYCCPIGALGDHHFQSACHFVATWMQFDPGYPHTLYVVSNGGPPESKVQALFAMLNAKFIVHDDSGFDIGAFQFAARTVEADLMVFLGGSTYIRGKNWLRRVAESFQGRGPTLFGVMGHTGDSRFNVLPHIRTTGFWMPPKLLNEYPVAIVANSQRYPFEHGENCLTQWVHRRGLKSYVVTWDQEYEQSQWGQITNGYHNGDQSAMMLGDRLSAPPFHPCP